MAASYEERTGCRPKDGSDIMARLRVVAGEIYQEQAHADYILRQMFPTTAVGAYLDAHAAQRGLSRRAPRKAAGYVNFYPEEEQHGAITIPAGTTLCTADGTLRYATDAAAVLERGAAQVAVHVTAVSPGAAYNVGGGYVNLMVTPVTGIARVFNGSGMSGGADKETDDELRARVLDSYVHIPNGTNAAYYKQIAMSVSGVYSASVVGCVRGAGTVDVYACAMGETLTDAKLHEIQVLMDEARELNVDVLVRHPSEVYVDLCIDLSVQAGYDFAAVSSEVRRAVSDYIDGLGIGRDVRLCDVGEVVYHIPGVRRYRFIESYGSDVAVAPSQYTVADTILVREA